MANEELPSDVEYAAYQAWLKRGREKHTRARQTAFSYGYRAALFDFARQSLDMARLKSALSSETAAREKAEGERDEARAVQFDFARMSHDMAKLRTTIADITRKLEAAAGAVAAEREECARVAEGLPGQRGNSPEHLVGRRIAIAIRAREAHAALLGKEKS